MELNFELPDESIVKRRMIDKFRQKKVFSLLNASPVYFDLTDISMIQHKIIEAATTSSSIQELQITILDNMSDEDLYEYIDKPDALKSKLHRSCTNLVKRQIDISAIMNLIEILGLDINIF